MPCSSRTPGLGPPTVAQAIEAAWSDYLAVAEPVDQARGFEHACDHVTYRSVWRDRLTGMVQVGDRVLSVANGVSVFEVLSTGGCRGGDQVVATKRRQRNGVRLDAAVLHRAELVRSEILGAAVECVARHVGSWVPATAVMLE